VGRDEQERELNYAVDAVRDHALCGDAGRRWELVAQMCETWPDGGDDHCDAFAAVCRLYSEPEQCQDASRHDAKVAQPVAESCTGSDGKWYMEVSTDGTVPDVSTASYIDGARTYPLRTVGIALHTAAANVIKIASVADSPVVKTELAADHPATVTRSENQYQVKAHPD
jgi:hypothetical protein